MKRITLEQTNRNLVDELFPDNTEDAIKSGLYRKENIVLLHEILNNDVQVINGLRSIPFECKMKDREYVTESEFKEIFENIRKSIDDFFQMTGYPIDIEFQLDKPDETGYYFPKIMDDTYSSPSIVLLTSRKDAATIISAHEYTHHLWRNRAPSNSAFSELLARAAEEYIVKKMYVPEKNSGLLEIFQELHYAELKSTYIELCNMFEEQPNHSVLSINTRYDIELEEGRKKGDNFHAVGNAYRNIIELKHGTGFYKHIYDVLETRSWSGYFSDKKGCANDDKIDLDSFEGL